MIYKYGFFSILIILALSFPAHSGTKKVVDSTGRTHHIPSVVKHAICSGPGCLRLLTYLQAQDKVVAVDDIEKHRRTFEARPYALANRQLIKLPLFGEFRGRDNPELILMLEPQPQVIFKTYGTSMGHNPLELEKKVGIPVVVLNYGDLGKLRPKLYQSLRIMGKAIGKSQRAEAVISFMESNITELQNRTRDISSAKQPSVFVGGVSFKGPHGFRSTEPAYPPFAFIGAKNPAWDNTLLGKEIKHTDVAKEIIIKWNPDILLLDLATLQQGAKAGGLHELRNDPAYRTLTAVKRGKVYGVLPYNLYTQNFGSILANAWFIGKLLYPERFSDVEPNKKADEIYRFLVGKAVFKQMNRSFHNMAFKPIPMK